MDAAKQSLASEMEFLAEDTIITIIPKFSHAMLHFISGNYGPFQPQTPVEVPLWLAISLKKRRKCAIRPPSWMDVDYLAPKLKSEKERDEFEDLPFHFAEIKSLLFAAAADDIPNADQVRTLLEDIHDVRQAKIRRGIQAVAGDVREGGSAFAVKMNGVGAMELSLVRPVLVEALNSFYEFSGQREKDSAARDAGYGASQRPGDVEEEALGAGSGGGGADGAADGGRRELRRFR